MVIIMSTLGIFFPSGSERACYIRVNIIPYRNRIIEVMYQLGERGSLPEGS
jgi:hypothetical protein